MVRVSAAEYDTLQGITVTDSGTVFVPAFPIHTDELPRAPRQPSLRQSVHHHSLDGVAAGGGRGMGHCAPNLQGWRRYRGTFQLQHLPRQGLAGPPGRHLPDDRTHDDRHRRHHSRKSRGHYQHRHRHLPLPHLQQQSRQQPSPGRVLQQLAVRPVGCRSARPRVTPVPRASRIPLPASPGRGGTSRESRRPGARKCPRDPAPPRIHPITRDRVPAAGIAGQSARAGVGMSCRHGRM